MRDSAPCGILVASIDGNEKNWMKILEKIGFVLEKMKNGVLLLFEFGISEHGNLQVPFSRKTIILTGKLYNNWFML